MRLENIVGLLFLGVESGNCWGGGLRLLLLLSFSKVVSLKAFVMEEGGLIGDVNSRAVVSLGEVFVICEGKVMSFLGVQCIQLIRID